MGSPLRYSPEDLLSKYGLEGPTVKEAFSNFDKDRALLLAFSGKIGAGKDSVAPKTFTALKRSDLAVETDSFGSDLKLELTGIIELIAASENRSTAARSIADLHGVELAEADHTVGLIYEEIEEGLLKTAYDRTPGSRAALQYWATEVRRAQDPLYWVKSVVSRTMDRAAEGVSTQITDVRFFTEAWGVIDGGGLTVRLDVSKDEQRRRVWERDGIEISEAARTHSSETELDSFDRFAVRINTDEYRKSEAVARAVAIGIKSIGL